MMSNKSDYQQLLDDAKSYLATRYDLLRLELLDKLSVILSMLLFAIVIILLVFAAIAFASVAIVSALAEVIELPAACCIVGAVVLLAAVTAYLLKDKLFVNPMVKFLSSIIFSKAEPDNASTTEVLPTEHKEGKEDDHGNE